MTDRVSIIKSFRSKALKLFFKKDDPSKLPPEQVSKLRRILALLNQATNIKDLDSPASGLHSLKGNYLNFWSVSVTGNWRVIFKFIDGDAYDVDHLDYH